MRALRLLTRLLAAGASSASAPLPKPSPAFDQIRVLLGRWPAPRDPSPIRNFTARSYFRSAGYHRGYWGGGNDVLYGLLGANVAVFFLWRVDPYFMKRHFTCSLGALEAGRLHTFVTSCFSHIELGHLAANMLGLYFFGRNVAAYFGPRQLLNLYMAGGVLSMMADVGLQAYNNRGRWGSWGNDRVVLGASGAVNAIVTFQILNFPTEIIYLNLFIPVPAFLVGLLFLFHDFLGVMRQVDDRVSHSGHLGGMAVGLAYFVKRRYF